MTPLMTFIPFADKNNEIVFRLEKSILFRYVT